MRDAALPEADHEPFQLPVLGADLVIAVPAFRWLERAPAGDDRTGGVLPNYRPFGSGRDGGSRTEPGR
ncbi:MAG: hypothetical protein ABWY57_10610 [Mycetocola sp.]